MSNHFLDINATCHSKYKIQNGNKKKTLFAYEILQEIICSKVKKLAQTLPKFNDTSTVYI